MRLTTYRVDVSCPLCEAPFRAHCLTPRCVYGSESVDTKVFIEFVALIIRNQIYNRLKEEMIRNDKKLNFMTVPAALRELEKIEMIKSPDNEYRLDHAVTATQKAILKAFGMTAQDIKLKAKELSAELARIEQEAAE